MNIDNYFKTINEIENIEDNVRELTIYNVNVIDTISKFILNNRQYSTNVEFTNLSDIVVDFIENYNVGNITEIEIELYKEQLSDLLKKIKEYIKSTYQINIFYWGMNKNNIMNTEFIRYKFVKIRTKQDLKKLMSKKKNNKNEYNILFVDNNLLHRTSYFDEVININKLLDSIKQSITNIYNKYYRLKYLKHSLKYAMEKDVESIVVGNSYPLIGIKETLLDKKTVNLSMSSQDLYYSFELAKKAISNNKNIKQCIFGISHYVLRYDVSRGLGDFATDMIKNVYYPLLNDIHNSELKNISMPETLKTLEFDIVIKNIFDVDKLEEYFETQMYLENRDYHTSNYGFYMNNYAWRDLAENHKELVGLDRVRQHNKIYKYTDTKIEYLQIFKDFINYMNENNIELIFVVFPTTKYYSENLCTEFNKEFDEILNQLQEKSLKIIDLRKYSNDFDDSDFCDADHLNEYGGIKATQYIKKEIEHIKN